MSTHKYIDRLCAAALVLCLLLTAAFLNGEALGIRPASSVMGYETRLFDTEPARGTTGWCSWTCRCP